jgi:hypothetical protein
MKKSATDEWACAYCDAPVVAEPKWWPTIEPASKFETSVGVCRPCFKVLKDQLSYENKPAKAATKKRATKKAAKKAK